MRIGEAGCGVRRAMLAFVWLGWPAACHSWWSTTQVGKLRRSGELGSPKCGIFGCLHQGVLFAAGAHALVLINVPMEAPMACYYSCSQIVGMGCGLLGERRFLLDGSDCSQPASPASSRASVDHGQSARSQGHHRWYLLVLQWVFRSRRARARPRELLLCSVEVMEHGSR